MHDMTINERFREDEALIAGLNDAKLDKETFEAAFTGDDYQGVLVNDIRVALNAETSNFELCYTVTEPLTRAHEKKVIPLDSPNNSVAVYADVAGLHIVSAPPSIMKASSTARRVSLKSRGSLKQP
jgi:hypothetical protein